MLHKRVGPCPEGHRGIVLLSLAAAIALGPIWTKRHRPAGPPGPGLGDAPSGRRSAARLTRPALRPALQPP